MKIDYIEYDFDDHFMINTSMRGVILGTTAEDSRVVDLYNKCIGLPIGILLNDVVSIDSIPTRSHPPSVKYPGSRVNILRRGLIVEHFNKRLKMPMYQPMYVDQKTNKLTWKYVGRKVGHLHDNQDIDGFCRIYLDFGN